MHNYVSQDTFYNIHYYMFRHFCVIIREFYICVLPSYMNSQIETLKITIQ